MPTNRLKEYVVVMSGRDAARAKTSSWINEFGLCKSTSRQALLILHGVEISHRRVNIRSKKCHFFGVLPSNTYRAVRLCLR